MVLPDALGRGVYGGTVSGPPCQLVPGLRRDRATAGRCHGIAPVTWAPVCAVDGGEPLT